MKKPVTPSLASLVVILTASAASAQMIEAPDSALLKPKDGMSLVDSSSFASDRLFTGAFDIPAVRKAEAKPSEAAPVFVRQDIRTLDQSPNAALKVGSLTDLSVLQEASAYRKAERIRIMVSDEQASGIQAGLAQISAAYLKPAQPSETADCSTIAMSVEHQVKTDTSRLLSIVESEIAANPGCACEIVKSAIKASGADESLVADITEVAITAAPGSMRMISQCAIAAMPDALAAVQAVLAKLDPNSGDTSYSSKGAKSGKEGFSGKEDAKASITPVPSPPVLPPNPLDIMIRTPRIPPPPVPPVITDPNPFYLQPKL